MLEIYHVLSSWVILRSKRQEKTPSLALVLHRVLLCESNFQVKEHFQFFSLRKGKECLKHSKYYNLLSSRGVVAQMLQHCVHHRLFRMLASRFSDHLHSLNLICLIWIMKAIKNFKCWLEQQRLMLQDH